MTFGEYYGTPPDHENAERAQYRSNNTEIDNLQNKINAKLNNGITEDQCKILSDIYTSLLYPQNTQIIPPASISGNMQRRVAEEIEKIENKALNNAGISNYDSISDVGNLFTRLSSLYTDSKETIVKEYDKVQIDIITRINEIKQLFSEAQALYESIALENESIWKTLKAHDQLREYVLVGGSHSIIKKIEGLLKIDQNRNLNTSEITVSLESIKKIQDRNYVERFRQLAEYWRQMINNNKPFFESIPVLRALTKTAEGTAFEELVATINKIIVGSTTSNLKKSLVGSKKVGDYKANKEFNKAMTTLKHNFLEYNFNTLSDEDKNAYANYTPPNLKYRGENITFSVDLQNLNLDDLDRQQKCDVLLEFGKAKTIPEEIQGQKFMASVKNWAEPGSFGGVALLNALSRSLQNEKLIYHYLYVMGDEYLENVTAERAAWHNYARLASIAELVMGYSQQRGYADTLILNIRAKKRVEVYSIKAIFDLLFKRAAGGSTTTSTRSDLPITGYISEDIEKILTNLRKTLDGSGRDKKSRSTIYKAVGLGFLNAIRVSVNYYQLGLKSKT